MWARANAARDPFSRLRANVHLDAPDRSQFLHPVLRYYHTGVSTLEPLSTLHIIEDFHAEWGEHVAHVAPLAQWLHALGARRAKAVAAGRVGTQPGDAVWLQDLWTRPFARSAHVRGDTRVHNDALCAAALLADSCYLRA